MCFKEEEAPSMPLAWSISWGLAAHFSRLPAPVFPSTALMSRAKLGPQAAAGITLKPQWLQCPFSLQPCPIHWPPAAPSATTAPSVQTSACSGTALGPGFGSRGWDMPPSRTQYNPEDGDPRAQSFQKLGWSLLYVSRIFSNYSAIVCEIQRHWWSGTFSMIQSLSQAFCTALALGL